VRSRFNNSQRLDIIRLHVCCLPENGASSFFALAVVFVVPSLSGVIVELREWQGNQIQCIHGGGLGNCA
jgi:hypothetical protein